MRAAAILAALTLSAHAQWTIQQSNTIADLRGIDNVGHGIAWASGTNGTVLHTTDNGATWLLCKTPPDAEHLDFRGIQAFDAKTAIVMSSGKGDLSRLYKTTDGCQTWQLVFTNPDKDGFWDAIHANISEDRRSVDALIAGDPVGGSFTLFQLRVPLFTAGAKLLPFENGLCKEQAAALQLSLPVPLCMKTFFDKQADAEASSLQGGRAAAEQGRLTLLKMYANPAPRTTEALFAASNSSLANHSNTWFSPDIAFVTGGPKGARFLTFRGWPCAGMGCTYWRVTDVPMAVGESAGAFSISVSATRDGGWHGVIVGGDYRKPDEHSGTGAFSADEGKTWQASRTQPYGYRSAVAYDAPTKTWITVGPNGTDISTDDGRNWRALKPSPTDTPDADQKWNALSLPFVVGPHGRIGLLNSTALQPAKP